MIMVSFLISISVLLGMVSETAVLIFARDSAREARNERAYYLSVAGARYAHLVVKYRSNLIPGDGTYTVKGNELDGGNFFTNLGVPQFTISIKDNSDGTYNVTSSCTYVP